MDNGASGSLFPIPINPLLFIVKCLKIGGLLYVFDETLLYKLHVLISKMLTPLKNLLMEKVCLLYGSVFILLIENVVMTLVDSTTLSIKFAL